MDEAFEEWPLHSTMFQRVSKVSQLCVWWNDGSSIHELFAKIPEDLPIIDPVLVITQIGKQIKQCFEVSKNMIDDEVLFNRCHISQSFGSKMEMSIESCFPRSDS